jgi:tetratricopeptide (TPR) repeat protein
MFDRVKCFLCVCVISLTPIVQAADDGQAKTYFNAGAEAFRVGKFDAASQAFEKAYELSPKPGVLFSLGQAERRQYVIDRDATHLEKAINAFRRYIEGEEQGGRRREAVEALSELEPLLAASRRTNNTAKTQELSTRLMVTSPTEGAVVVVDGQEPKPVPFIQEVSVGLHKVTVAAPGFGEEKREVPVTLGALVALDVSLRDEPVRISVKGPAGATVWLDGSQRGTLPLDAPLITGPGTHRLGLLKSGLAGYAEYDNTQRGQVVVREINPPMSTQRVLAWTALGIGTAAFISGVTITVIANTEAVKANAIYANAQTIGLQVEEVKTYRRIKNTVDNTQALGGALTTLGVVVDLAGLILILTDNPTLPEPTQTMTPSSVPP